LTQRSAILRLPNRCPATWLVATRPA
jgi:hypothetical protein